MNELEAFYDDDGKLIEKYTADYAADPISSVTKIPVEGCDYLVIFQSISPGSKWNYFGDFKASCHGMKNLSC